MTSALEMRQVSKVYGSGPTEVHALRHINLSVERSELVAVMGPSGSGKSSILKLLMRLYDPTLGAIVIDGKYDLREVDEMSLRSQMSVVMQETLTPHVAEHHPNLLG